MITLKKLSMRLIACGLLSITLSACVVATPPSAPLYYQPALYGYQPAAASAMDYYMLPRR